MTPAGVEVMGQNGHTLLVEKGAGSGSGAEGDLRTGESAGDQGFSQRNCLLCILDLNDRDHLDFF